MTLFSGKCPDTLVYAVPTPCYSFLSYIAKVEFGFLKSELKVQNKTDEKFSVP